MVKRYIFRCLLFIFLLNSTGHTHSPPNPGEFDVFYLHPVSLISGIIESEKVIYLTLNLGYLIINPSFLDKKDYYRFGSGFGYRNYFPITEVPIFYFQIMPSIHYLEYSKANSGKMINVLGYVGAADNFAFFDVGVGYEWNFVKKNMV